MNYSTSAIFQIPEIFSSRIPEAGIRVQDVKRALVAANDLEDVIFFETVSRNRHHNIMLFTDIEKAKEWLIKE